MELMLSQVSLAVQDLSSESSTDPVRFSARRALTSTSRKLAKHHGAEVADARTGVQYTLSGACSSAKSGKLENDDEQNKPVEASEDAMKVRWAPRPRRSRVRRLRPLGGSFYGSADGGCHVRATNDEEESG